MLFNQFRSKNRLISKGIKFCLQPNRRGLFCGTPNTSVNKEQCSNNDLPPSGKSAASEVVFEFQNDWPANIRHELIRDMVLVEDFINEPEERLLMEEVEQVTKRMRYEYDHWDDAIHGYRETEKKNWYPKNREIIDRIGKLAFDGNVMPHVHVLDLAKDGIIKAHVDSSRYCGSIIAGLSLLTDCIMRLKRVDETKYLQGRAKDAYQVQVAESEGSTIEFNYYVDVLLKQRSLYIMKDSARYKFSHEVLAPGAIFKNQEVNKDRRVSILCRNEP